AQIALSLMVITGDGEVLEEGEHLRLTQPEPLQEVAGRCLLPTTGPAGPHLLRGWIGREAGRQQGLIAGDKAGAYGPVELCLALGAGQLGRALHLPQEVFQILGPPLVVLLLEEGQLPQVLDVAAGMLALRVAR